MEYESTVMFKLQLFLESSNYSVTWTGHTHSSPLWQSNRCSLMSWALKALYRPGHRQQHGPIWSNWCFFHPSPYPHSSQQLKLLFFSFAKPPCKVAKACKPGTWVYGGGKQAYSTGPQAHWVQNMEARLGRSRDEYSSTVHSNKRMIKIRAGHRAPNTQRWQKEDNGQKRTREDYLRWPVSTAIQPQSIFFPRLGYCTSTVAIPWRGVSTVYSRQMHSISTKKINLWLSNINSSLWQKVRTSCLICDDEVKNIYLWLWLF